MSSLKIGIIGLPNAGKSTLFNALSRGGAATAPYPFTTVEPNVGVVPVPDRRLDRVAELAGCSRRVPATAGFVDIAGLVEGASRGEGLGNRFLAGIREVDALVHVVRAFECGVAAHVSGGLDPARDAELIETELRLSDMEAVERLCVKVSRDARSGDGESRVHLEALNRLGAMLSESRVVDREKALELLERGSPGAGLLTLKPTMVVLNSGDDREAADGFLLELTPWAVERGQPLLEVNAGIEAELAELDPEEAHEFELEMGIEVEGLDRVIKAGYGLLGLITFFSIDSGECRAWPVPAGSRADYAAGRIHSDFERGFVRAEVVHYDDFIECGCFAAARDSGRCRSEGREYVVRDGDVMHFKFAI